MNSEFATEAPTQKLQATVQRLKANIAAHPFVAGLSPKHLATLSDFAMDSQFSPGKLIFREGDIANRFYLILKGKVALETRGEDGNPVLVQTIGAGDVLGWSWLFPPYAWHFDARAIEPTQAIFFYGTWLREQCEQDRNLGYELMKRVAAVVVERLQAERARLLAISHVARSKKKPAGCSEPADRKVVKKEGGLRV